MTRIVYARWHGGSNYAMGSIPEDVETFPSMRAAGDALRDRANNGHHYAQTFNYADGRTERALTPCADESPSMTIYLYDPRDVRDPYPDRMITIGPRGGLHVEAC